jgi:hypothetical protein
VSGKEFHVHRTFLEINQWFQTIPAQIHSKREQNPKTKIYKEELTTIYLTPIPISRFFADDYQ